MIKAGIIGASTPQAGELIRLLVHHPDAEIEWLYAPEQAGNQLTEVHHGLIGDADMTFSGRRALGDANVLFIVADDPWADELLAADALPDDMRVVDMRAGRPAGASTDFEYGLSEINRKPLVRGARRAVVASAPAAAVLVSLYPIAAHLLLSADLNITIQAPADILEQDVLNSSAREIRERLRMVQQSFAGDVNFAPAEAESPRTMRIRLKLPLALSLEEIEALYDGIYDDHNFSFTLRRPAHWKEVSGTNKCLIALMKPDAETLEIDAVADCRLRGSAGEALHVMNLLCGLAERTGLELHATEY